MDQFLDRQIGWKIDQRVDVIGVHVIDLHVNAFGVGVFSEIGERRAAASLLSNFSRFNVPQIRCSQQREYECTDIGVERKPLKRLMSISAAQAPA